MKISTPEQAEKRALKSKVKHIIQRLEECMIDGVIIQSGYSSKEAIDHVKALYEKAGWQTKIEEDKNHGYNLLLIRS
jgi:nucleoside diphosphate kinase